MKRLRSLPAPDDTRLTDALAIVDEQAARETRLVERIAAAVIEAIRPSVEPFHLLSIKDTCAFFQVSEPTLTKWERDGVLRPFRAGKVVLYDVRAINAFVLRQQGAADDDAAVAA